MEDYYEFLAQIKAVKDSKRLKGTAKQNFLKLLEEEQMKIEQISETDFMSFLEIVLHDGASQKLSLKCKDLKKGRKYTIKSVDPHSKLTKIEFIVPKTDQILLPISQRIKDLKFCKDSSVYGGLQGDDLERYVHSTLQTSYFSLCSQRLSDADRGQLKPWGRYIVEAEKGNEENS